MLTLWFLLLSTCFADPQAAPVQGTSGVDSAVQESKALEKLPVEDKAATGPTISAAPDPNQPQLLPARESPKEEPPAPKKSAKELIYEINVEKIDKNVVYFSVPEGLDKIPPLKTKYFELEKLGILFPKDVKPENPPFVLLAGLPCEKCKEDKSLFMVRATGGGAMTFLYPGTVRDRENHQPVLKSRAFYGKCLPDRGDVLLVYQEEKVDRRRFLQSSVLVAEVKDNLIKDELITRRAPGLHVALRFVKQKKCWEIPGQDRLTIPFSFRNKKYTEENSE